MRLLLQAALRTRRHYALLVVTVVAMFLLTLASQTEMLALGVMAKTGPDVFTLFSNPNNNKLQPASSLSLQQIETAWPKIVGAPQGELTPQQADSYLRTHGGKNIVQRVNEFLDRQFALSTHLGRLAFLLVFVALFKAISLFAHRYFTQLVAIRVSRDLRQKYFEHIQSLPMSFYHEYDIGSLSTRVSGDASVVAQAINSLLINYIQTPFSVISTLIGCFYISWKLSLVIFVGFPLVVVPIVLLARKIKQVAKLMQRNQEGFAAVLLDFLSGILTVKIFAMEEFSLKKYREQNEKMARLEEKSARYALASRPILHSIASLFFATVILTGLYFFHLAPAELLVFCGLLYIFYEPIKKFAEENAQIFRGVAAAERMYEVLNLRSLIEDAPDAVELKGLEKEIEFRNVSFRYQETWILKNLSFTVKKGETVAIVGPTGAGKSTIVHLLPRLYDVQEGEILIDGHPLRHYTQRSLRERIAFVSQRPFLFYDTIRQNIACGKVLSDSHVHMAARRAHAEEFILRLPQQYDFKLEESGKNLSGGQQQRLAIARALAKEAPILVMDEATSALDAVSEGRIKEAIRSLHGKLTQILIAHRFSTIEHADRIIYLEHGEKVAEGTKEELLVTCPPFRRMWEMMGMGESRSAEEAPDSHPFQYASV